MKSTKLFFVRATPTLTMRKINEIFYSLQGEGAHTGIPSVFVRFSGCNLKCSFCDTRHEEGVMMSDDEIAEAVMQWPRAPWIILTGGEPSLFIDDAFIETLHRKTGKLIAIETNGTRPLPRGIDWITCSPKYEDVRIDRADEIKVVDLGQSLAPYFDLPCRSEATRMYLQPCFVSDPGERRENTRRTVSRILDDPRWRLSLQTHRYLDIR